MIYDVYKTYINKNNFVANEKYDDQEKLYKAFVSENGGFEWNINMITGKISCGNEITDAIREFGEVILNNIITHDRIVDIQDSPNEYGLWEIMYIRYKNVENKISLKIETKEYKKFVRDDKCFEIRLNDRNYNVGDVVILKEYNPNSASYTGNELQTSIKYIGSVKYATEKYWTKEEVEKYGILILQLEKKNKT